MKFTKLDRLSPLIRRIRVEARVRRIVTGKVAFPSLVTLSHGFTRRFGVTPRQGLGRAREIAGQPGGSGWPCGDRG